MSNVKTVDKQVRKVAQCVRTLLEADGVEVSVRKVSDLIKDQDLNNPTALTETVKKALDNSNDMRSATNDGPSERQRKIETFMSNHWALIRDDDVVRSALLDAYCKGRIKKDKRQTMQEELVKRCEGTDTEDTEVDDTQKFDF